jgi:hypothetical protein
MYGDVGNSISKRASKNQLTVREAAVFKNQFCRVRFIRCYEMTVNNHFTLSNIISLDCPTCHSSSVNYSWPRR